MKSKPATLLRGTVITVDSDRRVIDDGGVVVTGETISAVGPFSAVRADYPAATIVGDSRDLVVPGFINGHRICWGPPTTGDDPRRPEPGAAIFEWAVPLPPATPLKMTNCLPPWRWLRALSAGSPPPSRLAQLPSRPGCGSGATGGRITPGTWGWDVERAIRSAGG